MNYEWLQDFCLALPGTEQDYQQEWQADRFLIRGKMYLMVGGDKEGRPIITAKLEPAHGDLARQTWAGDVVPGYYMNKVHWNSVYREGSVPDETLKEFIRESHRLILASLPKKTQREIVGDDAL